MIRGLGAESPTGAAVQPEGRLVAQQQDNVGIARRIAAAWERCGVSVNCELCRHRDWNLVAGNGSDGVGMPLWQNGNANTGQVFLAYAVQCKKCGNVRVMSKARVEELSAGDKSAVR